MSQTESAKIIAILQPSYLPWLGYFDQIKRSDVFVFYDDVAFDKHGWRNRNRINSANGPLWLSVPVRHKGHSGQLIKDVKIDNSRAWYQKHLRSLQQQYARSEFLPELVSELDRIYQQKSDYLIDLNLSLIQLFMRLLGIRANLVLSSELNISGSQSQRLLNICQHFSAHTYLSGDAAKSYLDLPLFREAGVDVQWQYYAHPVYEQYHGRQHKCAFTPYLSIVDLLLSQGEKSRTFFTGSEEAS